MKKRAMKVGVVALSLLLGFTAVGCKSKTRGGEEVYTYNEYISASPTTWNTHIGTSDADSYVQQYTEIGLYDITLNEERTSYAFIDEMAVGDPVDVTANYVGQYGITANQTGKAFKINLNPDATWANGTKITADDYLYSMEQLLNPEMKNAKASRFYTGTSELYKAYNYYMSTSGYEKIPNGDIYTDREIDALVAKGQLYFSLDIQMLNETWRTLSEFHAWTQGKGNAMEKLLHAGNTLDGADLYETVLARLPFDNEGYIRITAENFSTIKDALYEIFDTNAKAAYGHWYSHCAVKKDTATTYKKVSALTAGSSGDKIMYTDEEINEFILDGKLYFTTEQGILYDGIGQTLTVIHNSENNRKFLFDSGVDGEGEDMYLALSEAYEDGKNSAGYLKVTADNLPLLKEKLTKFVDNITKRNTDSPSAYNGAIADWYSLLTFSEEVQVETAPFSEVGMFKDGDNAFVMVFVNSLTTFDIKYALSTNWLVYKDLYEAGKAKVGALLTTSYGTSIDTYMGYGPYKLTSYQKDKELVFERNETWYGYDESAKNYHQGQYQTDRIVTQVISDQGTARLEFEKGNLDQVKLVNSDLDTYKFSDYLLKRTGGNIWQIAFNSDVDALKNIEDSNSDGNRRILSVLEFRKALSLCLNRNTIGREIAAGSDPAYAFINENYYYNMQNDSDSVYRISDEGMRAIVDLYGIEYGPDKTYKTLKEAYSAVTGYDMAAAKANFQTAAAKAVEQGIYTKGQNITINIYTNDLTPTRSAIGKHMQDQVTEATKGTDLEGRVTINWKQSGNYTKDIQDGKIEGIFYSFVADYGDPYALIGNYVGDGNTIYEYGFNPKTETLTLTYDFNQDGTITDSEDESNETNVTQTIYAWQQSVKAGGTYAKNSGLVNTRLYILAQLEKELLSGFRTLPLYVGADVMLRSKKVNYATETANIYAVYGGVRLMTYNYTDAEWADYCKNNTLNYAD